MGFQLGGASHAAITQMRGREPGKHHRRPKLGGMRIRCVNCPEKFESMSEMVAHTRSGQCTESLKVEVVEHPSSLGLPPFAFNFDRDGRHMPVQDVDASRLEVDGLHHSPGGLGSKGVFFLKLAGEENSVVVIKQGSLESAGDFFASLLYDALYVPTPSVRVLGLDEFKRLAAAVGNRPCSVPGAADKLQFDLPCGEYSRGKGCLLMEYLRGQTLKHPDVHASLKDPAISAAVLRGLGAVIGVDILINNYDRAPYVWDHMGNANNLLIHVDGKNTRVSAIDQHCTAITNPEGLSKYLATVQKATREAVESDASGEYVGRYVVGKQIRALAASILGALADFWRASNTIHHAG